MIQSTQRDGGLPQMAEPRVPEQSSRRQSKGRPDLAQALLALQSGTGLDQLPIALALALQEQVGNSALLELVGRRAQGWTERPAFRGLDTPLDTPPLAAPPAELELSPSPGFAALSPMGEGAPMSL